MLEICPSIAKGKPSLEVHPLGIGGKADPVRLVFNTPGGCGPERLDHRYGQPFPSPGERSGRRHAETAAAETAGGARLMECPSRILPMAATAWIHAGGAHHTGFSQAVTTEMLEDFAEMAGIELVVIDGDTSIREFKQTLRWNEVYYGLRNGLVS